MNIVVGFMGLLGLVTAHAAAESAEPLAIVTLGNSITAHAPASSIGWTGSWGMGASAASKDYSGQFAALVENSTGRKVLLTRFNISQIERGSASAVPDTTIGVARAASVVVVELGDNVDISALDSFRQRYERLLQAIKSPASILLCAGPYWQRPKISEAIELACKNVGGIFVDLKRIQSLPDADASYLTTASDGVKKHPGDFGMKKIAEALHLQLVNARDYKLFTNQR